MPVDRIAADKNGGALTLQVQDPTHPQGITAVVWRFANETTLDSPNPVAQFTTNVTQVPLGAIAAIAGKGFLVDGFVKPFNDNPASPYQLVVTVLQDGKVLHSTVPDDNGKGTIGATAVHFRYPFFVDAP